MLKYNHYCVPQNSIPEGAGYVKQLDVYVTDCETHPMAFEFLFVPEGNTILPKELRTMNHLAFDTDEYDKLIKESEVLYEFICPKDNKTRMAFVNYEGAILEIKEI